MFEGSEGPARVVAGRYERRQTRQLLSALFLALFAESCTAAPTWQQRNGGDRRSDGRRPAHFWTHRTVNEPRHPEGGDLAGAATRDAGVVQQWDGTAGPTGKLDIPGSGALRYLRQ